MFAEKTEKILEIIKRTAAAIALVCFVGMLLSTGAQVLFRYVLEISVGWTEELARVLFILSMFLGIAIAIREKEHIVVDFIFSRLPGRLKALAGLVFNIGIFIFLISLMRGAAKMTSVTWESFMIAITWLRTGWLYFGECVAIALMMLFILDEIARNFRDLAKGAPESVEEGRS